MSTDDDAWASGQPPPPPPPPPPTPPTWGATPPPSYPYAQPQTEGKAIAALVCSIASFVVLPLFPAVVAVVLGSMSRKEIAASGGRLTGDSLALTGVILGWVNIGLCLLVGVVLVVALVGLAAGESGALGLALLAVPG